MEAFKIAVLIPCYNEAVTIAVVLEDFRQSLPNADIDVYDNGSSDETSLPASQAGPYARSNMRRGKGEIVRRIFADVEADIFVLVDGDGTYEAGSAPQVIQMLLENYLDKANCTRINKHQDAYQTGHRTGNVPLSGLAGKIFGNHILDILSGYLVFSRRFVESFLALSSGFEAETDLTIHALELRLSEGEVVISYRACAEGGASKLRTYTDGMRNLRAIRWMMKEERPLQLFSVITSVFFIMGIAFSIPEFVEHHLTGLAPRFSMANLYMGIMLLSFLFLVCALILNSAVFGGNEERNGLPLDLIACISKA